MELFKANAQWFAQGVTRYSQTLGAYTDERTAVDKAAGKVLDAYAF